MTERTINWLWDYEDRFSYHPEYNLSRLLPSFEDYQVFVEMVSKKAWQESSFLTKWQIFLTWLTDSALGEKQSPVYYMGLIGGHPPLSTPKNDEKPFNHRWFLQR